MEVAGKDVCADKHAWILAHVQPVWGHAKLKTHNLKRREEVVLYLLPVNVTVVKIFISWFCEVTAPWTAKDKYFIKMEMSKGMAHKSFAFPLSLRRHDDAKLCVLFCCLFQLRRMLVQSWKTKELHSFLIKQIWAGNEKEHVSSFLFVMTNWFTESFFI